MTSSPKHTSCNTHLSSLTARIAVVPPTQAHQSRNSEVNQLVGAGDANDRATSACKSTIISALKSILLTYQQERTLRCMSNSSRGVSPGHPEEKDQVDSPIIVTFDGPDDPLNPQNWPTWKKMIRNIMTASVAFIAGFGSSIDAPVISQAAKEFRVSEDTQSLATVVFLVGFGCGAPPSGPLSETFGRNPIYLGTLLIFCCWLLGSALSPNFGAQLAFRFLAGVFGSTAFTTAGGTLGDVFDHQMRGRVFPWFGAIALFGPMISPVVGGYVGESGMNWRWVEWITLCIAGGILVSMTLILARDVRADNLGVESSGSPRCDRRFTVQRPPQWHKAAISRTKDGRSSVPPDADPHHRTHHLGIDGIPDLRLHGFAFFLLRSSVHFHCFVRFPAGSGIPDVRRCGGRLVALCSGVTALRHADRSRVQASSCSRQRPLWTRSHALVGHDRCAASNDFALLACLVGLLRILVLESYHCVS